MTASPVTAPPGTGFGEQPARLPEDQPWAGPPRRYRALAFDFSLRSTSHAGAAYLASILSPLAVPGVAPHQYSLVGLEGGELCEGFFDGQRIIAAAHPASAMNRLLWDINRRVVDASAHLLLIHAATAVAGEAGLLFPAPSDSGKTTLVAGLLRAGLRYVTDEATAIDPDTLDVRAYPKPLSLDPGSWQVLADLRPRLPAAQRIFTEAKWQVPPNVIRPDIVAASCRPRYVIVPRYAPGEQTRLTPMPRAEAVLTLADNAFNFTRFGGRGLRLLAEVVRGCDCYRLTVGELEAACDRILDLVGQPRQAQE